MIKEEEFKKHLKPKSSFWSAFSKKEIFYSEIPNKKEIVEELYGAINDRSYYPSVPKFIYYSKNNGVARVVPVFSIKDYRFFPEPHITIEPEENQEHDISGLSFVVKFGEGDIGGEDMFYALADMYMIKLSAMQGKDIGVQISHNEGSVVREDAPETGSKFRIDFGDNDIAEIKQLLYEALVYNPLNAENMQRVVYYRDGADAIAQKLPVLDLPGVALINYSKSQKHSNEQLENENIFICANDEIFLQTIELLSREDVPENLDIVLIKRCGAGHAQSIKLERRDGKNNFIIVDSTPVDNGFSASYPEMTYLMLRKYFPDAPVYCLKETRQFARVGCHTYAIKDSQTLLMSRNMAAELQARAGEESERGMLMKESPGKFFVFTQSRNELLRYTNGGRKNATFVDKDGTTVHKLGDKIFKERVSEEIKHPYNDHKGQVPNSIDYFARKYRTRIDKIKSEKSPEELRNIIESQSAEFLTMERIKEISNQQKSKLSVSSTLPLMQVGVKQINSNAKQ